MSQPIIAVLAPGGMGSKIALRISQTGGGTILTNLEGRSEATRRRAEESGMTHASYPEIVSQATYILSVVPPKDAFEVAEQVVAAAKTSPLGRQIIFADCNAINPDSARQMSQLFEGTNIKFIDGAIVGPPPTQTYNPGIYVSAGPADELALDEFVALGTKHGLNIIPLKGEGSGVGDASALKMAHAGIVKGAIGLFVSMILAANASSSSTAKGLLHALSISQPSFIDLMVRLIPQSIPKAYRFVKEMEEVAGFVGGDEGRIYEGIEKVFEKIAMANKEAPNGDAGDAAKLLQFVEEAKDVLAQDETKRLLSNPCLP
ncbi:nad-binding phosphogluconate dehydrogenase-like protein [Moniliophthora roreri MCA 2997]|uniref:Nad-binding phosphogluconate dehydrogenase-like protein n=1 Tax=Moniliophthora roreri (strain MCA 2997) TaxID=1381753 RepID=V2WSH7_MONRO|nr:nad-binding phosphogluconate dehydrogenase-like protein [Moniliophthora roreri MCA 2997]KAI3619224.1 nad-binding phosphogluconate dehydrogenase-like protein [Moniliophthora roreri]